VKIVVKVGHDNVRSEASIADIGVLAVIRVPRDPPILEAGGIRPVVRLLHLPRPLYPAARFLIGRDLSPK